jgi:hypothetical protein
MKIKNIVVLMILMASFLSKTSSQSLLPVKKNEYVNHQQESIAAYSKIKEAVALYEKESNNADRSLRLFMEADQYNHENAELNYNIGICYLLTNSKEKASDYLIKAYKLKPDVSKDLYYFIGLSFQYQNEFIKAIEMFKKNIEIEISVKGTKNRTFIELCEKRIRECKSGLVLQSMPSDKKVKLLDDKVNSKYNELNPIKNGSSFYFSSQRERNQMNELLENVYSVSVNNEGFGELRKEQLAFGDNLNNAIVSLNGSNESIFYSGLDGGGDIFLAKKSQNKWVSDESLSFINKASTREASACISENELYFVSDRDGGYGACDIFYCTKIKAGKWSEPKNIGLDINTAFDEADVFVSHDGKELYFSSNGHNTMGGYDIFKCTRLENGKWSTPENMGIPVNSSYNEIDFYKSENGEEYLASDRNAGYGGFDLYNVENIAKPQLAKEEKQEEPKSVAKENPAGKPVITKEQISELIYRVQILACKNVASAEELYHIYSGSGIIEHQVIDGWHKYAINKFSTYQEASEYRDSCGVYGAFVVLFKNGEPLKLGDI